MNGLPIPPEVERAVRERVQSGRYASTDEVFLAFLRALEFVEEHGEDEEALRRELQVGIDELDRGEGIPGEEAIEWLWRRRKEIDPEADHHRSDGT